MKKYIYSKNNSNNNKGNKNNKNAIVVSISHILQMCSKP